MPESGRRRSAAFRFRSGDSAVHRLGAGWKLGLAAGVGGVGLALDALPLLLGLGAMVMLGYRAARLPARDLWDDARWLLLQGALVVALTLLLRGPDALGAGLRAGLQIALFFLPTALVLRTTSSEALLAPLRRRLPERLAFALSASLRFLPMLSREATQLVEMQRLRGARLAARELWRPAAWRDWLACVVFPLTVRIVELAEQAAEAAEVRGVGMDDDTRRWGPELATAEELPE